MLENDTRPEVHDLLAAIRRELPNLENLLLNVNSQWGAHDHIYRYYHQSFKVYYAQDTTLGMVAAFQKLTPGKPLNQRFLDIVARGTGKHFDLSDNAAWHERTGPVIEALLHAEYFLRMVVLSGKDVETPSCLMETHWAAVLYLYNLR